ncbi:PTS transporter subunit EIIC [Thermophilibacter sp.]
MAKHNGAALIVVQNVGGAGNVAHAALAEGGVRLELRDASKVSADMIATQREFSDVRVEGSWLVLDVSDDVEGVYDSIVEAGHFKAERVAADGTLSEMAAKKRGAVSLLIDTVAGTIAPIMGILCATGIIKGLLAFADAFNLLETTDGAYQLWYAVADGAFYFMPILLGITAARKFKCNEWLGAALGIALVYPNITALTSGELLGTLFGGTPFAMDYYTTFFGIPVVMPAAGYTSSVIPAILAVYVASKLEPFFDRHLPELIRGMFTPICVLVIMVPLTFLLIGPIATVFCGIVQIVFQAIYDIPVVGGLVCGALVGALWPVLVMFGFQWGLVPIKLMNLSTLGYDYLISPNIACSFTQAVVVLAIFFKTRNKSLKELSFPAFVSGAFGISEPSIYGVTLPLKKPFVIACVGAGIAGAIVGFFGARVFMMSGFGPFAFPAYIDPTGARGFYDVIVALAATGIGGLFSFIVTLFTFKDPETSRAN